MIDSWFADVSRTKGWFDVNVLQTLQGIGLHRAFTHDTI